MHLNVLVGQHNSVVTVFGEVGWQQIAKKHAINVTVRKGRSEFLLGPDNNIEFLKHFMNILLKNSSTET